VRSAGPAAARPPLSAAFLAPHDPRTMPPEYLEMYDPEAVELPPNFMGGHPFDNGNLRGRDESLAGFPRTPEETRRHLAEYYAMITHLDAQIGRILDAVRDAGLLDFTVIVLAGDNGLAVGQHGLFGKQNLYEHSVRVPLIFAGPGVPEGRRSDALVYLFDIFPTLCELTGLETPQTVEGRNLVPALHDPQGTVRETLYLAYVGLQRGVSEDRFKLLEYVVNGRHNMTQLFDTQDDPWELSNLAQEPAYADELARLRGELVRLRDESGDADTEWGQTFWSDYDAG